MYGYNIYIDICIDGSYNPFKIYINCINMIKLEMVNLIALPTTNSGSTNVERNQASSGWAKSINKRALSGRVLP